MIRVIIVDDHRLFAEGLERLLNESGHFQILGKFYSGNDFLANLQNLKPDILIIDIELGALTGLDLIRRVRLAIPESKIIMLSMHEEAIYVNEAIKLGADAFLFKSMEYSQIVESMLQVWHGNMIFPTGNKPPAKPVSPISDREKDVLKLLIKGKTSEQIASDLKISNLTVKTHRRNMLRKLKVNNVAELIGKVIESGYL